MNVDPARLSTLSALSPRDIQLLGKLGVLTLADLLAFAPFRHAELVIAARDGHINRAAVDGYLVREALERPLTDVADAPVRVLSAIGAREEGVLAELGLRRVHELATWRPFAEAEDLVASGGLAPESDPHAPDCVVPRCKRYTKSSKNFVSFFKAEDVSDLAVGTRSRATPIYRLFDFGAADCKTVYLGFAARYRQDWTHCGIHLGEPQGSVSLFMGQDTQISVLDWKRINRAIRREDSAVAERLTNVLVHQRAVDEVARATAEEHQHGATSTFGANAAIAGSFVAAGAILGGVGGGVSGALAGLVLGNVANAAGAAPTLAGAAAGTAIGSIAGAAAGSLVFAGATTLGFVETDVAGDRSVVGRSAQAIHQRSLQNASSLRSFWSNIVSQSVESEEQRLRTDRVTNHNRIHALNALYFEVLNLYRVDIALTDVDPLIFIPFKPFNFDAATLQRYWWILRRYLADKDLVLALDGYFLSLASSGGVEASLAALPDIAEVTAGRITVTLDFDGSAMKSFITTGLLAAAGTSALVANSLIAMAVLGGLVGVAVTVAAGAGLMAAVLLDAFYNAVKREFVEVALKTSTGTVELTRQGSSPNQNPEFVGTYLTTSAVKVETITGIEIRNKNSDIRLGIPDTPLFLDVGAVAFENVKVKVALKDKAAIEAVLPEIGTVENATTLSSANLLISGNQSKTLSWPIATTLMNVFEGVIGQQGELQETLAALETTEAKLANLIGFLNANRYGFTRLILQETEREQLICVLEQLTLGGIDLKRFAGTNPVGFCGAHVVLLLKRGPAVAAPPPPVAIDEKLRRFLDVLKLALRADQNLSQDLPQVIDQLEQFIDSIESAVTDSAAQRDLENRLRALKTLLGAMAPPLGGLQPIRQQQIADAIGLIEQMLDGAGAGGNAGAAFGAASTALALVSGYHDQLMADTAAMKAAAMASEEVSLPTAALFMEPVLSNAKGAEIYDITRNSHWDLLQAPGIAAADPNVLRAQLQALAPTVPQAVLQQVAPPALPLPGNLATALGEAGKLDLTTLLSTNAQTLAATLSNLSQLAGELAKASATLTGDAQKQALDAAKSLSETIGSVLKSALPDLTKLPAQTPQPDPKPLPSPPPMTLPEKGPIYNEMKKIDAQKIPEEKKEERKRTLGAATKPDLVRDYVFGIAFRDEHGAPYPDGSYRMTANIFETRETIAFNGGVGLPLSDGLVFFKDTLLLKKGGKVQLALFASFAGLGEVGGIVDITLPDNPGIALTASMKSVTETVSATTVTEAVTRTLERRGLTGRLEAKLEQVAELGLKLAFMVFEKGGEATAGGTGTLGGNLFGEYRSDSDSELTDTNGDTISRTFEVRIPLLVWDIRAS